MERRLGDELAELSVQGSKLLGQLWQHNPGSADAHDHDALLG